MIKVLCKYPIGLYYYHGYGVLKDENKGIRLIRKTKQRGYIRAESFFTTNNIK